MINHQQEWWQCPSLQWIMLSPQYFTLLNSCVVQLTLHLNIQLMRAFPWIFLAATAAFPDHMKSLQPIFNLWSSQWIIDPGFLKPPISFQLLAVTYKAATPSKKKVKIRWNMDIHWDSYRTTTYITSSPAKPPKTHRTKLCIQKLHEMAPGN